MKSDKPAETNQPARLGGARAEFVGSLGRKVEGARTVLSTTASERGTPNEKAPREELRRRLHALGASARLLGFEAMSKSLAIADAALDRAATAGNASADDLGVVANVLDDLPALAWGDGPRREERPKSDPPEEGPPARTAVLVGSAMLGEALTDPEIVPGAPPYECERTEDAQAAIALARKVAPDVIVIDADVADSEELVEALLDDPMTEPMPIVVVGAFRGNNAAKFVALGVARTMTKPITPEALRRACDEAVEQRHEVTMRVTLGEPTLEQLGERLAEEVRRAIVGSVDAAGRDVRVPLGEGTEVMSAMWGAIARVREVVVARTGGAVKFAGSGPEGAVAMAPWLSPDMPGTDRLMTSVGRNRGPAADVRLHGRRVIVADDDPGVTWFIADLLRTAGCNVHEALDGNTALDLAYRTSPEIVISDILMPGLDGFALTRALKRDVALRDVPVILLSWKEDLLQRVRELGASAAAYLRKESDSRAIVARVRECLRPRARVEARLRGEGEVRGRMDGLTTRSLLELACAIRPDSRVSVRDASFLYEVEIRDGAPRRITRTSSDGVFERGERVLAAMLGVGAGRFMLASSNVAIPAEDRDLNGSLTAQLARPVAVARAARAATTAGRAMTVEHVELDADALAALLFTTPEPARSLVESLAEGGSPRAMLLGGDIDPALLDEVLGDLALRGAITAVHTTTGEEVLARAVEALLAPEPKLRSTPSTRVRSPSRPPPVVRAERPPMTELSEDDLVPSSLADAVMRELSDRAPELRTRSSNPPPIVEPGDLRPRSTNPPAAQSGARSSKPSIPPDAIVPETFEDSEGDHTEVDAPVEPNDPCAALSSEDDERSISIEISVSAPVASLDAPLSESPRTPMASVASREPPKIERAPKARWPWIVALAMAGIAVTIGVQATKTDASASAAGAPVTLDQATAPAMTGEPVANDPAGVTYDVIPTGFSVPVGEGMLEVKASADAVVRVDGMARGSGLVRVPASAGPHEVGIASLDRAMRTVEVRAGRVARVELTTP
jgi:CheY-like chemotaxis protein